MNKVEEWKREKHGFDVWPDILRYAESKTPMREIDAADLERMKWHGIFYRKRDTPESYMLRIRLTGCELTHVQAKEIAYIAYDLGHGIIDLTTRANIQVQGLDISGLPSAIERLEKCGLTARQTGHDNIRNVFGHPLSGLDPAELMDTRSICHDIAQLFLGSRVYSDLPRKFNIAVSGASSHGLHYWTQDIAFLACHDPHGAVMFHVLVGGTQGQNPHLPWHLPVLAAPYQVVEVTRALLDLFRERGARDKRDRARFRYLIERIGVGGVLQWLEERLPFPLVPHASQPRPPAGYEELVGWLPQKEEGRLTMGLCVPVGRLSWQQLEGLGRLARKWGDGGLRTTHEQGILVTGIPASFQDAAATDAAALGLSPRADTLTMNTVACTGKQFCNIAVTETKGHMLRLIDKLRQRLLTLHGIRIHMSGCPSSCAQHFTADIGLKGVRVRRLLGTREGFDVYLGGGITGQVHLGIPYRLGVDVDQLPLVLDEVVREFYLKHRPGQTFSAYWRDRLAASEAVATRDEDYHAAVWLCDACGFHHMGEDPPVFCPNCAALRRAFARIEGGSDGRGLSPPPVMVDSAPDQRPDGFVFAARLSALGDSQGLAVEIQGKEYALFRVRGEVVAIENACPHEGAPLSEGTFKDGVVTCPWHGWSFQACTGCSVEPPGHAVRPFETRVEGDGIWIKLVGSATAVPAGPSSRRPAAPVTAELPLAEVVQETHDIRTFRFTNHGVIPGHLPGQFARIQLPVDGCVHSRSFTISSAPGDRDFLDLTIKRNPRGIVSNRLHDEFRPGERLLLQAPLGGFYWDEEAHREPLVLISAGSGITPMIAILRHLASVAPERSCTFLHGARTSKDVPFREECARLCDTLGGLRYRVTLSQPTADWPGPSGRIDFEWLRREVFSLRECRYFLCGPLEMMETLTGALRNEGIVPERIHTEQFHPAASLPTA